MRWYLNLKMRTKLLLAFACTGALTLVIGLLSLQNMKASSAAMDRLCDNELAGVSAAGDLRSSVLDVGRLYRQALLEPDRANVAGDAQKVDAAMANIDAGVADLQKLRLNADETTALGTVRTTLPDWKERVGHTLQAASAGDLAAARAAAAGNGSNAVTLVKTLVGMTKSFHDGATAAMAADDAAATRSRNLMVTAIAFSLLLAVGLGLFISTLVSRPLQQAVHVLGQVAQGDFTQRLALETRDELGQMASALNHAVDGMRTSLVEVRSSSQAVANASRELSASSTSISSGAQQQASALEETAASLEEITSTVQQNADNSQQASQIAHGAREVAEQGGAVVAQAVVAMSEIDASSKHIAQIITTIDEIAFQTNLLALNAAVEAARAGEQGRGFAVVAGEVRVLAQRSASAAKEIKGLIEDSLQKVESGTQLVNRSGATLEEIVSTVKRVTDIVTEIAAASREQSAGIGQVGTAVSQMDQVTQANAAQTEELAGTAESLSAQAVQLQAMVGRYRLDSNGSSMASALAHAPVSTRQPSKGLRLAPAPSRQAVVNSRHEGFEEF